MKFSIEKSDDAKRSNPRRESFLKKKMKRLSTNKNSKKTNNSSRMGEFTSPEAIQLSAKFALANLISEISILF
jgi:hypothetical protein